MVQDDLIQSIASAKLYIICVCIYIQRERKRDRYAIYFTQLFNTDNYYSHQLIIRPPPPPQKRKKQAWCTQLRQPEGQISSRNGCRVVCCSETKLEVAGSVCSLRLGLSRWAGNVNKFKKIPISHQLVWDFIMLTPLQRFIFLKCTQPIFICFHVILFWLKKTHQK